MLSRSDFVDRVRGRPLAHGQPAEREGKRLNGCAREIRGWVAPDVIARFSESQSRVVTAE
jgi:hypothetical protein